MPALPARLTAVALGLWASACVHRGPAVAQDGGDIVYRGFDKGKVYLALQGACAGCPSSTATLKNGIEQLLRYYVPEVTEVRAV